MGYESDSSEFARIPAKKLAILFGLAFFGAFMLIQMVARVSTCCPLI